MGSGDRGGVRAHTEAGCFLSVKTLRKKQTQAETATQAETPPQEETWRPRITRRSTILDYVNVVPNIGALVRGWRGGLFFLSVTPELAPPQPCSHPLPEGKHVCWILIVILLAPTIYESFAKSLCFSISSSLSFESWFEAYNTCPCSICSNYSIIATTDDIIHYN